MKYLLFSILTLMLFSCGQSELVDGYGDIEGYITNGQTGAALSGVTVYVEGFQSQTQTTTNGSGYYRITNVQAGTKTINVSISGYIDQRPNTFLKKNKTNSVSLSLLTTAYAANKLVAILSWNTTVQDLDSHLYVPVNNTAPSTHIYYQNIGDINNAPFAVLDVDDTDGSGPETIAVKWNGTALSYPRKHRYFVHNFTQQSLPTSPDFTQSEAQVRVYRNGTLISQFSVPDNCTQTYWHVFDIESNGAISPNNSCSNTIPSDVY